MIKFYKRLLPSLVISFLGLNAQAQYCTPTTTCGAGGQITSLVLYDETQAQIMTNSSACEGYGDFTNLGATDVNAGMAYTLEATTSNGTFTIGTTAVAAWIVWGDWDQSGTFDAQEVSIMPSALTPATIPIIIPPNAVAGETRLRVKWDDAVELTATTFDDAFSCEGGTGEVEDYLLNVTGLLSTTPGCAQNPTPADTTTGFCNHSDSLKFEAPEPGDLPLFDPTGYLISLWTDNGSINYLIEDSNIADALAFDPGIELTPGEKYYWQVKPMNALDTNLTCDVWSFTTSDKPNPAPQIAVDGLSSDSLSICVDINNQLSITDLNGTDLTGATYLWSENEPVEDPLSDLNINNPINKITTPNVTYSISVVVTDDVGCSGVDSVKVTTKPRATAGNILTSGTQICENDISTLSLQDFEGDSFEWQYSYTGASYNTTADFDTVHTTSPITQDTYFMAIVSLDGCADSTEVLITKLDLPFQPLISASDTLFCNGDSISLQAIWPGPGEYEWNDLDTSDTDVIWVKKSGNYNVKGIGLNGCVSVSENIEVTSIEVIQPLVNQIDNSTYYVSGSNADVYTWYSDTTVVQTGSDTIFTAAINGEYYVVASKGDCETYSDDFVVDLNTSISEYNNVNFQVYPNPTNGEFSVKLNKPGVMKLISVSGAEVYSEKVETGVNVVKLSMPVGMYFVVVEFDDSSKSVDRLMIN